MDPQQELFTGILMELRKQGYDVYDSELPPEGTPYPFIYLADSQQTDRSSKGAVLGTVRQTIHVWGNSPGKRGMVSAMLFKIKAVCRRLDHTQNFSWMIGDISQRILTDTTTKHPLLHGILEVEFRFS